MNAFARALAALHRDLNLSVECTWVPAGGDLETDGVTVRGVLAMPVDQAFGAGPLAAMAERLRIDVLVADVATIVRNDRLWIDGASRRIEQVERDIEGLTWRLTLSKAS